MKLSTVITIVFQLLIGSRAAAAENHFECIEKLNQDFQQHLSTDSDTTRLNCLEAGSLCYWDETKTLASGESQVTRTIIRDVGTYSCTFSPRIQNKITFSAVALLSNSEDLVVRTRSMFRGSGINCQAVNQSPARPVVASYMGKLPEMYTNFINQQKSEMEARISELSRSAPNQNILEIESERLRINFAASTRPQNFISKLNHTCGRDALIRRQFVGKLPRLVNIHDSATAPVSSVVPGDSIRASVGIR